MSQGVKDWLENLKEIAKDVSYQDKQRQEEEKEEKEKKESRKRSLSESVSGSIDLDKAFTNNDNERSLPTILFRQTDPVSCQYIREHLDSNSVPTYCCGNETDHNGNLMDRCGPR